MPPKETSALTAGDQKFFTAIFKYLPNSLDIDWDGLAQELNLKDSRIAKMRFSQIRRRYRKEEAAGGSPQQTKSARVTKSTKGKKAKAAGKGRDESDSPEDDEDMKPVTKKELKDDAAGVIKIEDGDDDEVIATQK
ncbi:uncharacterized protein F4817DRAFT_313704 [Daldinia loculata]|uniref:uncharacterized protein n=1 Tax=Daldinia loculata TaxID=103429 RepID=UPI0020C1CC88|nr:uncharacterized protein F4817DRAFT_313704 [Daldinia loculata]KAI1649562.1 hypothetical protein F4817DRAFT_313704 [Daldinia loculata]